VKLKKLIYILTALCLFHVTVYGSQDVIVNLDVHKITINCETNAKIKYNNQEYEIPHDFFVLNGSDFIVEILCDETNYVDTIIFNDDCNMSFSNNYLTIYNVYQDVSLNVLFKEGKDIIQAFEDLWNQLIDNITQKEYENIVYDEKIAEIIEDDSNVVVESECCTIEKIQISETLNGRCLYQHYFIQ